MDVLDNLKLLSSQMAYEAAEDDNCTQTYKPKRDS